MNQIKEFYYINKKIIIILISIILFIIMCFVLYNIFSNNEVKASSEITLNESSNYNKEVLEEPLEEYIVVDIKGKIHNPGVYSMKPNDRIIDVINKAGGLLNDSNTDAINLSMKVKDEMVIIVYSNEDMNNFIKVINDENKISSSCNDDTVIKNDACIINENETNSLISINTATLDELMTLPSIGESKAKAIIKYREENGLFENIDDIKEVSGIGEALFEKIKDFIKL